jgi:hypothetical protein
LGTGGWRMETSLPNSTKKVKNIDNSDLYAILKVAVYF